MHTAVNMEQYQSPQAENASGQRLRILSYNIQAGISISRFRHYLTHSWKHLLPYPHRLENLERIAHTIRPFDIVGLQEVDGGSFRSDFINQVEHLAEMGHFPYWYQQLNRNLGKLAQHSNGLLSRIRPSKIVEHKLPGLIPGRGAIAIHFGHGDETLVLIIAHLALSRRAQRQQIEFLCELAGDFPHAVLMGDFNCSSNQLQSLPAVARANLHEPLSGASTYPSWRPQHNLDHILVTPSLKINSVEVLKYTFSDHLPVSIELSVPETVELQKQGTF